MHNRHGPPTASTSSSTDCCLHSSEKHSSHLCKNAVVAVLGSTRELPRLKTPVPPPRWLYLILLDFGGHLGRRPGPQEGPISGLGCLQLFLREGRKLGIAVGRMGHQ